jgi:DNA repair protein RecO (recombination protein O)
MAAYQTYGIILKKTDRGEVDQLFSIYTQQQGKITALGRGTKKITSKLNGHLQPFAIINLMVAPGKNFDHVAGAVIIKRFFNIQKDLKKIALASFGLELVDKINQAGQPEPKMFALLARFFSAIDSNLFTDREWHLVRQAFIIKLLTILGLRPNEKIIADPKKLDEFFKNHLDFEIQSEKLLFKAIPLTTK